MLSNRLKNSLALLIYGTCFFVLAACQNTSALTTRHHEYVNSGDILPINTITSVDGVEVDLQRLGKKKLVILFATWCHDSNNLLKAINRSPLFDENIEIIAIAKGEDKETVKAWRDARNIKVPLAVDRDKSIYKQFASGGIPRIITVSENNRIIQMNLAEGSDQLAKVVW